MHFDKTCCGTTCDAKANAEYVAKLEKFVRDISGLHERRSCLTSLGEMVSCYCQLNEPFIKHAQQNHNSNGVS